MRVSFGASFATASVPLAVTLIYVFGFRQGKLNQNPVRIRRWIKEYPNRLKREGVGPGTRFSLPLGRLAPFASD